MHATGPNPGQPQRACCDFCYISQSINIQNIKYKTHVEWGNAIVQSGIHGWGLIARTEMKQDSMVVEYRGDLLRPKMSEDRQKYYNRIGKDCYLFNVNDDVIIDATMTGAVGRFTVSSCKAPLVFADVRAYSSVPLPDKPLFVMLLWHTVPCRSACHFLKLQRPCLAVLPTAEVADSAASPADNMARHGSLQHAEVGSGTIISAAPNSSCSLAKHVQEQVAKCCAWLY